MRMEPPVYSGASAPAYSPSYVLPSGRCAMRKPCSAVTSRPAFTSVKQEEFCSQRLRTTGLHVYHTVNAIEICRQSHLDVSPSLKCSTSMIVRSNQLYLLESSSAWQSSCLVNKSACALVRSWFCVKFGTRLPFLGIKVEKDLSKARIRDKILLEDRKVRSEVPSPGAKEETSKQTADTLGGIVADSEQQAGLNANLLSSTQNMSKTIEVEQPGEPFPSSNGWVLDTRDKAKTSLCITILGATGDLARNKIFPALFALFNSGCLPENVGIFGFSRSKMSDGDFRDLICQKLTCRVDQREDCGGKLTKFLQMVQYEYGQYEECDAMTELVSRMKELEGEGIGNRIFYLSVPYEHVPAVARCVSANGQSTTGWTRVILEKPFGHDAESSATITDALLSGLSEEQIYRIDQHLGKELMENLTVLRFSNLIFEPLWSRTYIRNVQVILSEDWGVEGRGRYFDEHGIIRDIVQSHVLQTIALFAMEPPVSLDGEDVRNEKVKVLRSMRKPSLHDVVLGQYKASVSKDGKSKIPGYLDEPHVPSNSLTPTFVAAAFYIDNARWDGVPFLIKAGVGLIKHRVEIRIQFRHVPGNLYRERFGYNLDLATNQLIIRIQPDEGVFLKVNNKVPGLGLQLDSSKLNLLYRDKYDTEQIPDSYERLILDVIDGDNHLFIRADECQAAWDLLDPILCELEEQKVAPELYPFGGRGPIGAYYLGAKHGVRWADDD